MHDIIGEFIDWDQANKAYLAGKGHTGQRYTQRPEAADRGTARLPGLADVAR
jgi:hypothetical protein